jgi:hypothetical protein
VNGSRHLKAHPQRSAFWKLLVRVHVLLWLGIIAGVTLAIAFGVSGVGETGVLLCLIIYLTTVALVGLLVGRALGRSKQRPILQGSSATEALIFVTDAVAASALMMGFVLQAASATYGQVYGRLGFAFMLTAGVAWLASFIAALRIYFRTGNRMLVALVCCFIWISIVFVYEILTGRQYWGF